MSDVDHLFKIMLEAGEALELLRDLHHLGLDATKGGWKTSRAALQALDLGDEGQALLLFLLEKCLEVDRWGRRWWRRRSGCGGDDDRLPGGGWRDLDRRRDHRARRLHNLRLLHDVSRHLATVEVEDQLVGDVLRDRRGEADGVDDGGHGGGGGDQDAPHFHTVSNLQPGSSFSLNTALSKQLLKRCSSVKASRFLIVPGVLQLLEHVDGCGRLFHLLTLLDQLLFEQTILCLQGLTFTPRELVS